MNTMMSRCATPRVGFLLLLLCVLGLVTSIAISTQAYLQGAEVSARPWAFDSIEPVSGDRYEALRSGASALWAAAGRAGLWGIGAVAFALACWVAWVVLLKPEAKRRFWVTVNVFAFTCIATTTAVASALTLIDMRYTTYVVASVMNANDYMRSNAVARMIAAIALEREEALDPMSLMDDGSRISTFGTKVSVLDGVVAFEVPSGRSCNLAVEGILGRFAMLQVDPANVQIDGQPIEAPWLGSREPSYDYPRAVAQCGVGGSGQEGPVRVQVRYQS